MLHQINIDKKELCGTFLRNSSHIFFQQLLLNRLTWIIVTIVALNYVCFCPRSSWAGSTIVQQSLTSPTKVNSVPKYSNDTAAICLVVKNETLYLDEWTDYHLALGFNSIYIYDTSPSPDATLLQWYAGREDLHQHVVVAHDARAPVQQIVYRRCLKVDAVNNTFAALFDIDEFLVLKKDDNVIDFLNGYCDDECGQLSINWLVMGSSGETKFRPVPVTKRFVYSEKEPQSYIKTIVRPNYVADKILWVHTVALTKGYWVDTNGRRHKLNPGCINKRLNPNCWGDRLLNKDRPSDVAVLYHYKVKSAEEIHFKLCLRGVVGVGGKLSQCGKLAEYDIGINANKFDDTAWEHVRKLVPKYRPFDTYD